MLIMKGRRTMGNKLSHNLMDLGFFSALGTSEHPAMERQETHVKRGKPNTYDSNNGVTVVYDEEGRPWIIRSVPLFSEEVRIILRNLKHGAYVPHSNDGGNFVLNILPTL